MIPTIETAWPRLRDGTLKAAELMDACLDRIARHDDKVHAHTLVCADAARQAARAADAEIAAGRWRGPLHGLPLGVKDIIETADVATTGGSHWRLDHVPPHDAASWARLLAAGTILVGKHNTHEFALGGPAFDLPFPPARNPWKLDHFTGGSSSGAGAAVAAGFCLGALGTDTSGSIRGPASFCGVAGLKPTLGLVSTEGVFPLSSTQDHVGPLAWTVADCAWLLDGMAGTETAHRLARDIKGLRIGVARRWHERDMAVSDDTARAMEAAFKVFAGLGAEIVAVDVPELAEFHAAAMPVVLHEAYAIYGADLRSDARRFSALFRDRVLLGAFVDKADYQAALRLRARLTARMREVLNGCDVLATACMGTAAPKLGGVDTYYFMDNASTMPPPDVTGQPALSFCIGFDDVGLPLSLQLISAHGAEVKLLSAGAAYEAATPWRAKRPGFAP
jgi:aspartyl-tRNA(Asn)/glutamyl-tRNA(Gln) amidotransferase subunit A